MKIAVCDIGSNTIKMKIYNCEGNNAEEIFSTYKPAKLISYIKYNLLSVDGVFLLCDTIKEFLELAKKMEADAFYAFATASLRKCRNSEIIIKTVSDACSLDIDLVSGDDEAFYSFMGVKNTMHNFPENCIMLDMGGGSTELVVVEKGEKIESHSMNFGSLSLSLELESFDQMKEHATTQAKECVSSVGKKDNAILVGGTALAIAKVYSHYFNKPLDYTMKTELLTKLFHNFTNDPEISTALLKRLVPDRATTFIPGLSAYIGIFELFGIKNIKVSTSGIREGYVYEKILKSMEFNR